MSIQIEQYLRTIGLPTLSTYTFNWLVLAGLVLTTTLLLLILLVKRPASTKVSFTDDEIINLLMKSKDFNLQSAVRLYQIAKATRTTRYYFGAIGIYMQEILVPNHPEIKSSVELVTKILHSEDYE